MASNFAQEPVTYTCDLCESGDEVRWYCNDCQDNLCDRCKEAHTRGKKTRNDDVVSITKANRQSDKPVPEVCKAHPGKLCDLFCSDCDQLICGLCFAKSHNNHNWKPFEEEFVAIKQHMHEHMKDISAKIKHFQTETSERHRDNKRFNDNIDTMREEVNSQTTKLKAEVDSVAGAILAELSALKQEESSMHKKDVDRSEKKVGELTRLLQQAEMTHSSSASLFDTARSLRTSLLLYDVNTRYVSPKQPRFVTGGSDRVAVRNLLGEIHQYEMKDIDSKHVYHLSKFTVTQRKEIYSICPVDDSHAWLSIREYQGLVLVNRKGVVIESIKLDFCPCRLIMIRTTDMLMTRNPFSTSVLKLSLHNKQVTTFVDISPNKVRDVGINERGDVFVCTDTPDIVVLNQSGTIIRKVSIGSETTKYVVCLSSERLCIVQSTTGTGSDRGIQIVDDQSCALIQTWTGELANSQKVDRMYLLKMSRDNYDRVFVPDIKNNQVYVLPRDGKQAVCLLDRKHGVAAPTAVGVDTCGDVWVGCNNGTVHVMGL